MFRKLKRSFKELRYKLRRTIQRATRGYADEDVWNMDMWFLETIPKMLRQLGSEKSVSFPGCVPWETPEKWHAELEYIARGFEELLSIRDNPWYGARHQYVEIKRDTFNHFIAAFDDLWD